MIAPRNKVFLWAGLLIATNLLSIAVLIASLGSGQDALLLGYIVGSLFAHTTLAAAWTTFGPAKLLWRLPLSVCWVCSLGGVMALEVLLNNQPREIPFIFLACFLSLWLVLQLPLWGLKLGLRATLRHREDPLMPNAKEWQFGIRQLLTITTMVAIAFAVGRAALSSLRSDSDLTLSGLPVFLFLAASAISFSLLLLLASLQERLILGVAVVSLLIVIGTVAESPLMLRINGASTRPNLFDLIAVNVFTCGIVFLVAITVRHCGYTLTRAEPNTPLNASNS